MSETPRTDRATFKILSSLHSGTDDVVHADFARELEIELTIANTSLGIALCKDWTLADVANAKQRIAALERELAACAEILGAEPKTYIQSQQRIAALEKELSEAKVDADAGLKDLMTYGNRIAALEQTLREVRSLVEPYAASDGAIRSHVACSRAVQLIDRTLEPRDE